MDSSVGIMIVDYLLLFCTGLIIGSFINVVLYRLHHNIKGIFVGRSFCPHCRKELQIFDLVPVISFLYLGGKCRYCAKKISWIYPVVELTTAGTFVYLFWIVLQVPPFSPLQLLVYLFYGFVLVTLSFYDLQHQEIPNILIIPGIVVAALLVSLSSFFPLFAPSWNNALIAVAIAVIFLGGQVFLSRETWMGKGDVYVGIFIGLILGWQLTIVALFFSYMIGAIVGILLIAFKKKSGESQIPFGPFLSLGTLLAMGFGERIIQWYLSLLG